MIAAYIAFESAIRYEHESRRTFGPALYASYWHALWGYFIAPPIAMLAAAEIFLLVREREGPYCATLHHRNDKRCIFRHSGPDPTATSV
jgi:aquaporin Z